MYCRCRFLRVYHEVLYSQSFTRPSLRNYTSSATPDDALPPPPEKSQNGDATEAPGQKPGQARRGSSTSSFAFKPLPGVSYGSEMDEATLRGSWSPEESPLEDLFTDAQTWTEQNRQKRWRQRVEAEPFKDPETALHEWQSMRSTHRSDMANFSAIRWSLIGIAGCEFDSNDVMAHFARDLVDSHKNSPRVQSTMISKVLHRLLFPGGRRMRMEYHPTFRTLISAWSPSTQTPDDPAGERFNKNLDTLIMSIYKEYLSDHPEEVRDFPRQVVTHLALIAMRTANDDLLLKGPLLSSFLGKLKKGDPTTSLAFPSLSPTATISGPSPEIFQLYCFVQKFLNQGLERESFRIFQKLVKYGFVSHNAISQVKLDGRDLKEIILFAMVRSCLDHQWVTGALDLLYNAVRASVGKEIARSKETRTAINETAYLILKKVAVISSGPLFAFSKDVPTGIAQTVARHLPPKALNLLKRCLSLISGLRDTDPQFMLDDKVIQTYYELAQRLDAGPQAEALYSIGRYNNVSRHRYLLSSPPFLSTPAFTKALPMTPFQLSPTTPKYLPASPQSPSLPLSDVDHLTPVFAAKPGSFKYPPPHGSCLTWLLSYLATTSKNVHLGRILAHEVADKEIDIPLLDRSKFISLISNLGFALPARKIWTRYSKDVNDGVSGNAAVIVRLVGLFSGLIKAAIEREALRRKEGNGEEYNDFETTDVLQESSQDLRQFVELVILTYRNAKDPLANAVHQDLNALARAYFITGQVTAGFDVLQIVMEKKETPDLYDVNVALSGLAKYSPRQAANMIQGMIEKGLLPNAITFGTVIKEAIRRGDKELMVELVRRAREVDEGRLTFKTASALVKASVSDTDWAATGDERREISLQVDNDGQEGQLILGGTDVDQIKTNLETAWALMQTFKADAMVGLLNLAEHCLIAALRVGDPELAFKFWELFLRKKAQWNDPEQAALRRKIAKLVQTSRDEGRLDVHKAKVMLGELDANQLGVW